MIKKLFFLYSCYTSLPLIAMQYYEHNLKKEMLRLQMQQKQSDKKNNSTYIAEKIKKKQILLDRINSQKAKLNKS